MVHDNPQQSLVIPMMQTVFPDAIWAFSASLVELFASIRRRSSVRAESEKECSAIQVVAGIAR